MTFWKKWASTFLVKDCWISIVFFFSFQLGMVDMFDPHKDDLRGTLDTNQQLYVSDAQHKAFIEVNEDGSEAAATCKDK